MGQGGRSAQGGGVEDLDGAEVESLQGAVELLGIAGDDDGGAVRPQAALGS